MKKTFDLLPPMMPNFIFYDVPAQPRQAGFNEKPKISVIDLSEEEAVEYGELMKKTFIEHWRSKKFKVHEEE